MSNEEMRRSFDPRNDWFRTGEVTPFGEQVTAEFSPLIELDSSNGLSLVRRDTVTETGSGTVTNTGGEFVLSSGTIAGSTAELRTKERGRYQPGIVGLPGVGIGFKGTPTGDQDSYAGYFDDVDGVIVGRDFTGDLYIQYWHNSTVEDKVYQSDWNGNDRLDGNGPSQVNLNATDYFVARFPFVWYYGGPIIVRIQTMDYDGRPIYAEVHRIKGPRDEPIFSNPKLPINAVVDNGTTTSDISMTIGGRQFAVVGKYQPNRRGTAEYRTGVSIAAGATEPLISFRKKNNRADESKSVKVLASSVVSDRKGILKLYFDGILTGASFGDLQEVTPTETALESDISATAISGGDLIRAKPTASGQGVSVVPTAIAELAQDLPDDTIVTLAFENLSAQEATVDAVFEAEEEW